MLKRVQQYSESSSISNVGDSSEGKIILGEELTVNWSGLLDIYLKQLEAISPCQGISTQFNSRYNEQAHIAITCTDRKPST